MLSTSIRVIIKSFAILICMIMSSIKSYRALILCSILHLWSLTIIKAQDGPFYRCPSDPTFTPNSTYQTNRNALLSSLSSNSTRGNGFYSLTIGNNTPDITSGLFLCRGDVNNESCGACVRGAAVVLTQSCPDQRSAIIHFDDCVLSYWNEGYDSSTVRSEPFLRLRNAQYISEPGRFRQLLLNTMTNLTSRAAASKLPGKKFATQEVEFSTYQTIYCLAQCTPDLSEMHCRECLNGAVARIQHGRQGGRIIFPSCTVRFNLYPFYTWTVNHSADAGSSPIPPPIPEENNRVSTATIVAIVVPVAVVLILVVVGLCFFVRKKARKGYNAAAEEAASEISIDELLRFGLASIEAFTNNFSADYKLGEGGFGDVYKGMLPDGQEIAVKRLLNANFLQGAQEFKNEVALVAKLQHRNLVRLLGYCLEANEKILVYEFVPNKSLDYFLFGSERKEHLDWSTRYKIIDGIARGMVYLHEDSRLRIIHRDLKAANVLLDKDMTPKIADFGTARIIGVDQTDDNTKRVVGTFGYMAPEYVMHGNYSLKSDVYSFGVLVLEIISGKKNKYQSTNAENLLQYAWKLWNNNTPFEVLDPCLGEDYSRSEVMRCFRIALLCVQEDPADRPSMMAVVLMLGGQSTTVPDPNQPASVFDSGAELMMLDTEQASKAVAWSVNEASISELLPR